jgi:phosphatidylethanolamine-binding protein (PEBP) family uncharacterized protein
MPKGGQVHFKPPSITIMGTALALGLALAGCGGTSSSTSQTSSNPQASASKTAPPAHPKLHRPTGAPLSTTINVSSPAVSGKAELPSRYTCDGSDTSLPIKWGTLPRGTAEVALFMITAATVNGELGLTSIDWGVTNLRPSAHGIAAGRLPSGAIVGSSEGGKKGYSLCPPKGPASSFAVLLYALPHQLAVKAGFDAATTREKAASSALAGGVFLTSYKRH